MHRIYYIRLASIIFIFVFFYRHNPISSFSVCISKHVLRLHLNQQYYLRFVGMIWIEIDRARVCFDAITLNHAVIDFLMAKWSDGFFYLYAFVF